MNQELMLLLMKQMIEKFLKIVLVSVPQYIWNVSRQKAYWEHFVSTVAAILTNINLSYSTRDVTSEIVWNSELGLENPRSRYCRSKAEKAIISTTAKKKIHSKNQRYQFLGVL